MNTLKIVSIIAVSGLMLAPALPVIGSFDAGAAFAKSEKSEGGGGGGGKGADKSADKGGGNKSGGKSAAKSKDGKQKSAAVKSKKSAVAPVKKDVVAKAKAKAVEGELLPNELGKMNGAMHANINAVLAHIRNGQTTNGPVGLLAGLAVADAAAAEIEGNAAELQQLADDFDTLQAELDAQGYLSIDDYLAAKADGTATDAEMTALNPLVDAVGGTTEDGLALVETAPTAEEIAAAEDADAEADALVTDAEQAIIDAWNKDGDSDALLAALRERLALYETEISETIDATSADDEEEVILEEDVVVIIE